MTEPLTRDQFRIAVADAVTGVLNLYREVDAMLRELAAALGEGDPRFVPLVKRLVPGAGSKNPDARYLRNYHASVFALADADEEEDEEEDAEDEEDADTTPRRAVTIPAGDGIVLARASIYERSVTGFEPNLAITVLANTRIPAAVPDGTALKVIPVALKKVVRALDNQPSGKHLKTVANASVAGPHKGKHRLSFDVAERLRYPLFDVTPDKIVEIANEVRVAWPKGSA